MSVNSHRLYVLQIFCRFAHTKSAWNYNSRQVNEILHFSALKFEDAVGLLSGEGVKRAANLLICGMIN